MGLALTADHAAPTVCALGTAPWGSGPPTPTSPRCPPQGPAASPVPPATSTDHGEDRSLPRPPQHLWVTGGSRLFCATEAGRAGMWVGRRAGTRPPGQPGHRGVSVPSPGRAHRVDRAQGRGQDREGGGSPLLSEQTAVQGCPDPTNCLCRQSNTTEKKRKDTHVQVQR